MAAECLNPLAARHAPQPQQSPAGDRDPLSRADVLIVAAATLAALVLRGLLAARSGLWRDEAQFLFVAGAPSMTEMLDFVRWHEWHPPLFYVLMRGWLGLTGPSRTAALALPVLFGVLLVPAVYLVGARLFLRQAGVLAAVLAAVAPWSALYSAEVRPYSLLPLLVLLASYFLWRGLRDGGLRPWLGYGVATLGMLLTHHWSWLILGAEWVVVGLFLAAPGGRPARQVLRNWLLAQCGVLLSYGPWYSTLLYQAQHGGHAPLPLPLAVRIGILLAVLLLVPLTWWKLHQPDERSRERYGERLAMGLCLGVPFVAMAAAALLSVRSSLLFGQSATALLPTLLLAIAHGLAAAPSLARGRRRLVAAALLAGVFLLLSVMELDRVKSNAREVAATLAEQARPDDLIVIAPAWLGSSFNHYYTADNPQIDYPYPGRMGAVPWDDLRERCADPDALRRTRAELARAHADGRRVWMVTFTDYETEDVGEDEALPPWADSAPGVAFARTNQVRRYLMSLYGTPTSTVAPGRSEEGRELLRALLFTPSATAD
jgi:hypothetical protein